APAVLAVRDRGLVDQAQVDDVDRDLGVEAGPQLAPDQLLHRVVGGVLGQFQRLGRLLADRVGVLPGDPEQVAFHEHRVAATQGLGDVAGGAGRKGDRVALRNQDRGAIALEAHRFTAAGVHDGLRVAPHVFYAAWHTPQSAARAGWRRACSPR